MPDLVRISLLVLTAWPWGSGVADQTAAEEQTMRVSLLTILPGSDIHTLWGHSALRVMDPASGTDLVYNYGTFDFGTDYFVLKFLHGNLEYMVSRNEYKYTLRQSRAEGRPVIEQLLDLSPEQQVQLVRFLENNLRPENRGYRYDFLFDNCSTRIRDALQAVLGGAIAFPDEADLPTETFRTLIDPYQRTMPFLDAGIDWLLGVPVDRTVRPYETMFLPDYLKQAFDHTRIEIDGVSRPLVTRTDTLLWIDGYGVEKPRFAWEILIAWLPCIAGLAFSLRRHRMGSAATSPRGAIIRILDVPLLLTTGLAGSLIVYLWFFSLHDVSAANPYLFWNWPTHLIAAAALLAKRPPAWVLRYMPAAGAAALASLLLAPIAPQPFHPMLAPIALLIALRGGAIFMAHHRRARVPSPPTGPPPFHRPAGGASADRSERPRR